MELIERHPVSTDWITLALVLALLLLVGTKLLFPERFDRFTKLYYSKRYFKLNQKTLVLTDSFTLLLSAVNIVSVSLLIYVALATFSFLDTTAPKTVFIQIMLGYSLFFIIKSFLEKITAAIFAIDDTVDQYLFYKITHANFLAFVLLFVNVLLIYGFQSSPIALIFVLSAVLLINMAILVDFYRKKRNLLFPHWFYLILYLCTFEIAPYFILFKVVTIT